MLDEVAVQIRKVNIQYLAHHVRFGKSNVMEITAPQEWIGQVFFSIGGDDNHRPGDCLYGLVDFDDVKFHLVQYIEHIILKIRVGLIDFVNQQNRSLGSGKGLADLAHLNVLLDIADIT